MTCLFCKIAAREIPSEFVLENEHAFAFLDINPLARGHILVIPKGHAARVEDMSPDQAHAVIDLGQEASRRLTTQTRATGTTVAFNNGRAAGQEVMHAHLHVVPRFEGDGYGPIHALFSKRPELQAGELAELALKLRG